MLSRVLSAVARTARKATALAIGHPGAFVLLYHRVATPRRDPWQLAVSPENFEAHLRVIREHAEPLSLKDFCDLHQVGKLPSRAVAVTFDDGYLDNLDVAKPLLESYGIPATVFLATGYAGPGRTFWWDELEEMIVGSPDLPSKIVLDLSSEAREFPNGADATSPRAPVSLQARQSGGAGREALYMDIWQRLRRLPGPARDHALASLRQQIEYDTASLTRAMNVGEIRSLIDSQLISVGAHTVTHPSLTELSTELQWQEIEQSRRDVQLFTMQPVEHFSYPHGMADSTTIRLVRDAGFRTAAAVSFRAPHDCRRAGLNPFEMPRVNIGNWGGELFRGRMRVAFE